jgi:hypothetical protein
MWPVLGLLVVLLSARLTQTKPPGQYAAILRSFGGPEKFSIEDYWPIPEDFKDDEVRTHGQRLVTFWYYIYLGRYLFSFPQHKIRLCNLC